MTNKFLAMRRSGSTAKHELAQLLMIVSDGRGLFLEGVETVKQAVRHAMNSGVFLVFVIIDNPDSKVSTKSYSDGFHPKYCWQRQLIVINNISLLHYAFSLNEYSP